MIKILADALVPIFAGLLLGYFAGLRGVMDDKNVQALITLVMSFAVPCALFLSIISAPRAALREEIPSALVFALGYTVVYALSFLWTTYGMNLQASDSSVVALTIAFPNSSSCRLASARFGFRFASHGDRRCLSWDWFDHYYSSNTGDS